MLLEALRHTFAFGRWDGFRFLAFLDRHEAYFPPAFLRPSFLDNHDMNRFLWAAGSDRRRLKLAALCQFTLAGPPVIYYGTEVGLSQERDLRQETRALPEESRLPMIWGEEQDEELLAFYRQLIALRRSEPALCTGERQVLSAGIDTFAYTRRLQRRELAAVFNLAQETRQITLDGEWQPAVSTDAGCRAVSAAKQTQVELSALGGMVVVRAT